MNELNEKNEIHLADRMTENKLDVRPEGTLVSDADVRPEGTPVSDADVRPEGTPVSDADVSLEVTEINELYEESEDTQLDELEEMADNNSVKTDNVDIEWIECEKPKKKKKIFKRLVSNLIRYAVMLVALFIFGYAAYELTIIYVESKEATDKNAGTKEMFLVDFDSLGQDYEVPTNGEGETIEFVNKGDGKLFVFDYKKMLEYNSDSKGYIRQDNGEYIDNPILQTTDNDYYLNHLADHKKSSVGAIFIDYRITEGLHAKNCIIYGHNMGSRVDHAMFGSLNWYYYKTGYYKEHPTFDIWIEDTRYRYYVYAVFKAEAVGSEVFTYEFETDEDFMTYVSNFKSQSKYNFKEAPEITADSSIITLVTCTSEEENRMIVQLVRGEELDIYGNPVE